ncbi:hypothetical protein M5K25_022023 [Dendrobium thyrsiflorum]|uniref:Endonuclease/exonuclease/phosphatase domain-containing protein n=1 Tax=Dendrobium thyrsiflorum TaxID=117978 RepID=A0ABD0U5H3_DENTH
MADVISTPWIIMGDFNYFREPKDKSGGAPTHFGRMGELNGWVFSSGVNELHSTGSKYTWFNGRVDDPIHIKLDRMFVNQKWLEVFPLSYYKVAPPCCSDHSPLLLMDGQPTTMARRFQFKNYWLRMNEYWGILLSSFASHHNGSPIANLYGKLRSLKANLKLMKWSNDHYIKKGLENLNQKHKDCLELLQHNPQDPFLNASLKDINSSISNLQGIWSSRIIQRAKAKWLKIGEDDLGFLYAHINTRANSSRINEITTDEGHFSSPGEIAKAICKYFNKIYNPLKPSGTFEINFPCGEPIPPHLIDLLLENLNDNSLADFIPPSPALHGTISDYWNHAWLLPDLIPIEIQQLIIATPVLDIPDETIIWKGIAKPYFKDFRLNFFEGSKTWASVASFGFIVLDWAFGPLLHKGLDSRYQILHL